jgi:hypothetical protein
MIKIAYNRKAGPNPRNYSSIRIRPLQSVKITCTVLDRINTITQVTKCNRHWLIKGQLHSHPGPQMNQTLADKGLDLPDENTEPACWKSESKAHAKERHSARKERTSTPLRSIRITALSHSQSRKWSRWTMGRSCWIVVVLLLSQDDGVKFTWFTQHIRSYHNWK